MHMERRPATLLEGEIVMHIVRSHALLKWEIGMHMEGSPALLEGEIGMHMEKEDNIQKVDCPL